MATVEPYQTAAGKRYRVTYRTPEWKQTSKRGFRTKRDAELFLASVEVARARGESIDPGAARATIGEFGPERLARQTHLKPSALRPVESAWRVHVLPRWGATPVSEIRKTAVQSWVSDLSGEKGAKTVIRVYGVLAAILDEAVSDRRLFTNPARRVNLPRKTRKPHVYLTHEQVHDLAVASWHPTLVLVLAYRGFRWGKPRGCGSDT